MPIRTNRGRAAVYRRLWGWPMRSPRHLVATVLIVGALVLTIGLIVPRLNGSAQTSSGNTANVGGTSTTNPGTSNAGAGQGAAPAPGQSTTSTSLSTNRQTAPVQTPTPAPPAPKALEVVTTWARAWLNHPDGVTAEQWLNALKPYTTEEQIAVMSTVDPRNIPATEITGQPTVKVSYTTSVEYLVPTNAGTLDITAISTPAGWRVAKYEQA
jgi:hypothetical protein